LNILALSPHTDDVELGAGASLSRWKAEGHTILSVAFSTGSPMGGSSSAEFMAACAVLGVEGRLLAHRSSHFFDTRQDILGEMERLRDEFNPDLVLVHATGDKHQDHEVVTTEALRAFKTCSILGYETAWSSGNTAPTCYVRVKEVSVDRKMKMLYCYQSQQGRHYFNPGVVLGQLSYRGAQVKVKYAEAFQVIRWVQ